jgi:hypothetical protein
MCVLKLNCEREGEKGKKPKIKSARHLLGVTYAPSLGFAQTEMLISLFLNFDFFFPPEII